MLAILGKSLLGALIGFIVCGLLAGVLVHLFSGNTHDKAHELVLSTFLVGLGGAVLGLLGTLAYQLVKAGS